MKGVFRKLFNIYSGEEKNAFLFACLGFLWALGVTAGLKFSDALFLIHVGAASLPTVYCLTACGMIIMAAFLLKAFNTFSAHRIFIAALIAGACFYSFAYFCLSTNLGIESQVLWFALRIFGSIFFAIIVTCFWTFVDQYYHHQDAKRLYSLFSSSVFLGIATTGVMMRSGLIDFQHVTLFIVFLLILTSYWITRIVRKIKPVYDENVPEVGGEQGDHSFRNLVRSVLSSKFTLLLMASNFLIFVLMVITEYSYMSSFDRHFDPNIAAGSGGEEKASLTLFLGQSLAVVSILNLVIGLFIYSRLVRRFGVNTLVMCTPIVLLVAFSGWSWSESLIFPLMGFFVVEGMLYVFDDSNFTLLLNAVPPKLKYKIRLTIESFFEPIGMLISSLLITFLPINSIKLGLVLAGCALGIGILMRKQYLKAIYFNLSENAIHFQRTIRDWFVGMSAKDQQTAERRLLAILHKGDEHSQLFAIEGLLGFNDPKILQRLLKFADALKPTVKVRFTQMISTSCFATDKQVINHLYDWAQDDPDLSLQSAIYFYFAQHGLLHTDQALQTLDSDNLSLKGASIISLKKSADTSQLPQVILQLQRLLDSENEDEICMAITILSLEPLPDHVDTLLPFLKHSSQKIERHAAAAIAQIADKHSSRHSSFFYEQLTATSDSELRQSYLKILGNLGDSSLVSDIILCSTHFRPNERRLTEAILIKFGLDTVPVLLAITKDTSRHDRCRVLAGRILGRLAQSLLREHLYEIVSAEIERAYFYFYHHHSIQKDHPDLDLTMLKDALLSSFHSVQDFIIQLLGVAGESEDCELLSHSLRSPNPKVRSHVLETLEKDCETRIFRALYPLIADLPNEEKMQTYIKEGRIPLTLSELLDKMSASPIQVDQIMAATLKYRLNMPNWRDSLQKQMNTHKKAFHHFAYEILET